MKIQVWQAAKIYAALVECREELLSKKNKKYSNKAEKLLRIEHKAYLRYQRILAKVIDMTEAQVAEDKRQKHLAAIKEMSSYELLHVHRFGTSNEEIIRMCGADIWNELQARGGITSELSKQVGWE